MVRDLLRLTRPLNLLIIAATMALMRHGLLGGLLEPGGRALLMEPLDFWLLVLSTVLIAAAGNVINDYFDTRIDRINKPGQVIVGRTVKRRVAMLGHLVLSGTGLVIGAFVAYHSGAFRLVVIPAFAISALWMYSTVWKRRFLIGNTVVALLAALVPLSVGLYEIPKDLVQHGFAMVDHGGFTVAEVDLYIRTLWTAIICYSAFAFLATLVRELQKDMADIKGDAADGCRTVPIVLGITWAKALALSYIAVIVAGVLALRMLFLNDRLSYWYLGVAVLAPLLLSGGFTFGATDRKGFMLAGHLMKFAMVTAVGYAALIRYTL